MADEESAAMALFRLHRLPTLAQLQKQARVPTSVAPLQTDSRECLFDAPGAKATPAHCAMAFQAVIDHLQGRPPAFADTPPPDRGGRRRDARARAAALAVACPFYVRWEVPRYSPAQLKRELAAHATRAQDAARGGPGPSKRERRRAEQAAREAAAAAASAAAERRAQEMQDRVLRWPLNPTPWLDDEEDSTTVKPEDDDSDDGDDEDKALPNNLEPAEKALVAKGPPVKPGETADEYERVHMDPIYDYIRGLETEHGDDALWSVYFPRQPTLVRWKKVHPMDRVRAKAELDTISTNGKDGLKNMSRKSLRRLGKKKKKKSEEAGNDEAGVSSGNHSIMKRSDTLEAETSGSNLGQWRMLACLAPMISSYKSKSGKRLTLSEPTKITSTNPTSRALVTEASSDTPAGKAPDSRSSMKGSVRKLKSSGGSMVTFQLDDEEKAHKNAEKIKTGEDEDESVVGGGDGGNRLLDYEAGDRKWQGAVESNQILFNQNSDGSSRNGGRGDEKSMVAVTPGSFGMKPSTASNLAATPLTSAPGNGGDSASFTPSGGRHSSSAVGRPSTTAGSGQQPPGGGWSIPRGWTADEEGQLLGDTDVTGAKALLAENRRNDPDFKTTGLLLEAATSSNRQDGDWRSEVADLFDRGDSPSGPRRFQGSSPQNAFDRPSTLPQLDELNNDHFGEFDDDEDEDDSYGSSEGEDSFSEEDPDEGPEVMTDASYELRGLGGVALPTPLLSHYLGEVSLWAASQDPHFMPMTKADLVGAPPHTPLASNISADSLLVTAHQRRVRVHEVKRAREAALRDAQEHAVLSALARQAAISKHAAKHKSHGKMGCFGGGCCLPRRHPPLPPPPGGGGGGAAASTIDPATYSVVPPSSPSPSRRMSMKRSPSMAAAAEAVPLDMFDDDDCGVPPLPDEAEIFRGGARVSVLLLGAFETCDSAIDFNPKMHGLFATFPHPSTGEELRGLLLPPLPERQAREDRAPAPPFWVEGDPTALEGYAANRAHVLRRLLVACGFDGSVTETVARSMHLVRFQVSSCAQMTFAEFRQHQRKVDAEHVEHLDHEREVHARREREEREARHAKREARRAARLMKENLLQEHQNEGDLVDVTREREAVKEAMHDFEAEFGSTRESVSAPAASESSSNYGVANIGPPPGDSNYGEEGRERGSTSSVQFDSKATTAEAVEARTSVGTAPMKSRQPEGNVVMRPQAVSDVNADIKAHETTAVYTAPPPPIDPALEGL